MSRWRPLSRTLCSATAAAAAPAAGSRLERLKKSKAGVWCRSLLSDYKEACREVVVGSWERPVKASLYASLLGGVWFCFYTRPDQSSFEETLLDRSNQLALLSPWIRNGTSDGHVQSLVKLRNEGRLRCSSLGLVSVVYRADYDPDASLYEARCSGLAPPWRELPQRFLDVGFMGRWWLLDSKMKDHDVNDTEFTHLPAHMQDTAPPSVQEVETSERLHKESWLALKVEEEQEEEQEESTVADRKEESGGEENQTQAVKE
ncbi:mitochondrial import inner membrane translocase subunit Tim29 [Centropristis striata]|uniref:mitochondrial import inner membrane translocase subunit Tim29 n=1 Tax=Centropristis striata TaxID=184440 RepID=UPI0027E0F8B5|nr:mitochondrial import inner membrane translocase subunit Tim29 [Centropristis striata]